MKKRSLNFKIWAVVMMLSSAFVFASTFSIFGARKATENLNEVVEVYQARFQAANDIKNTQRAMMVNLLETIVMTEESRMAETSKRYDLMAKEMFAALDRYEAVATAEGKQHSAELKLKMEEFAKVTEQARDLAMQNKNDDATALVKSADLVRTQIMEVVDKITDRATGDLKTFTAQAQADANQTILLNILVPASSILASLAVAFLLLKSVNRAIGSVVKGLGESANQVTAASAQIASASSQLSQAATEQAAALEETAASVEELNSMVAKNSENAVSTASTSSESQRKAAQGKETVARMGTSMDAISQSNDLIMNQINQSNEAMAGIVKVIEQIDKKTKVINEIVNKTELLSFNASVEAARAGEHGKGFAVVAEEVGNLARMSGSAAEEIGSLLAQSIAKVNEVVNDTKVNVEKLVTRGRATLAEGAQVVRETGSVFEDVLTNVNTVADMAGEISSASQEQARGISEITKAMSQLDQMTQQNAATAEQCASAAEELSAQAGALNSAVGELTVTVYGGGAAPAGLGSAETRGRPKKTAAAPAAGPAGKKATAAKPAASKKPSPTPAKEELPDNVVLLRSPQAPSPKGPMDKPDFALKKASGDVPDYNHSGFDDV